MRRVLAETGVERTPAPPEGSYLSELFSTVMRSLFEVLSRASESLRLPPWLSWGLLGLLLVLIGLIVARLIFGILRARRRAEEGDGDVAASHGLSRTAPLDAAGWRAELERRLDGAQVPEALEALWWWIARTLAGADAEPDWTSRDLLARSRRYDLRDLVRRVDAFTYGPRLPQIEEVRGLVGRLEEALS